MTTLTIASFNCIRCGLPNGEAQTRPGEPCFHCRVRTRAKDERPDEGVRVPESRGEGEERSSWRLRRIFGRRSKLRSS